MLDSLFSKLSGTPPSDSEKPACSSRLRSGSSRQAERGAARAEAGSHGMTVCPPGCYSKSTRARQADTNTDSSQSLGWKSRIRGTGSLCVWWGPTSWFVDNHLLIACTHGETGWELSGASIRLLIPLTKALPSWPSHPQDPSPLNTIALGSGVSTYDLRRDHKTFSL